jgi:hypothetical protein
MGNREALHHLQIGLGEQAEVDLLPVELDLARVELRLEAWRPQAAPDDVLLVEDRGQLFDPPVLEQPLHELLARVLLLVFVARQEQARLQREQPGRHPQKLAGNLEVELLHRLDVGLELVADGGDRDVVDRHLVLADQVQQQVERAREHA